MNPVSVLLIDDNPDFLKLTSDFLRQSAEIQVVGLATGGKAGLQLAHELKPDVVVIDLDMPDFSGLQAMPILRDQLPATAIIALTVFDSEYYRHGALSAGADAFVCKADLHKDLTAAIRRLTEAKRKTQAS
jgi:DNA-binding NarL/FixJ family response regulator